MKNTRSKSCYTCLIEDRNTWPLKEYSHIYIKLFDKSDSTMLNERHICWECRAIFRKIQQFINKATYAQSILSQEDQADGAAPSNNESAEDLIELDNQNGHPDIIALTELDRIKSLPLLSDKPRDVCDFADQFENSVAALRALKRPNYLHNFLLVRYLTEKLPPVLRVPWYEHYYDKPQDEPDLLTFNNYIVGLARRCRPFVTPEIVEQKRTRRAKACAVCEQDRHAPAECPKMKGASFDDRWVIAKEQRLCFRCLRVRASFHKCGFKKCQVDGCERSHHPLLHERPVEPEDAELEVAESEEVDSEVAESEKVDPGAAESVVVDPEVAESGVMDPDSYSYVRILPVRLSGPKDHLDTFAVLADGSVATLLDADVAAQIGADGPLDPIGLVDFTGTQIETARLVSVHIQGQGPAARHEVQARTTKNLRLLPQTVCDRNLRHYKHLDDIRQYLTYESGRPTLLIGQDNCSLLVVEENNKCLSTLKSVKGLKSIKVNYEQIMLNKDEERDVKEDYDIVMKIEESTVDCNINNTNNCDNNFILDETLIKTENREITKNEYFDGTMSDNENKIYVLEIKNEEIPCYTKLNNDEVSEYDNFNYDEMVHNMYPTCNKNYTVYDSEDEIILNKQTYSKVSQKRKKKYMQNDSDVKFEDTYKIVPLTDQEEEDWLKIERMDVTFNVNEFKCEKCVLHWKSKEKMIRHDSTFHNRMTDNKCVYCDAYFQNSSALRVHQDSRHCKLYVCVFCNTKYHTRKTMYDHYDEKHNNTFQCKECPVSFGKSYLVREHYKQMHEQFECDYCKKVLPTKQKLITHIGAKHQIFCDICYKEFPVRKQLSYHKATKHKIKEDETTFCVECNKQFTCALKYTIHIQHSKLHRMQNGQPPLYTQSTCLVCKKVFFNKTIMENHYNYVHLKKYNFTCDICNKNFVSGTKLSRHKKRCHLGIKPARDKMCNICGRGFPENYRLKSHMLTHTGERPFECPHCSSRFSQKGALSLHIKKVHVKKEIE